LNRNDHERATKEFKREFFWRWHIISTTTISYHHSQLFTTVLEYNETTSIIPKPYSTRQKVFCYHYNLCAPYHNDQKEVSAGQGHPRDRIKRQQQEHSTSILDLLGDFSEIASPAGSKMSSAQQSLGAISISLVGRPGIAAGDHDDLPSHQLNAVKA
jgi:hypothetical protein